MSDKAKRNITLCIVTLYCALSWVAMRLDYLAQDGEIPTTQQFAHLGFTAAALLILVVWKGRSMESFIGRLSALPPRAVISMFVVGGMLVFTMMYYPRNRISLPLLTWGLMESTRSLVEGLFLGGAIMGLTSAVVLNARALGDSILGLAERALFRTPRRAFLVGAMLIMFLATNAVAWFQFHHMPICSDAVSYVFQAKIFASGRLWAEPPRYPQFFEYVSFMMTDKWYSIVAPGFPLLLVPGVLLGATWVVNPLLASLSVLLAYLAAEIMYDERIARGAAALLLVSPFVLMLSSSHLSHTATAFFFLLFLYLFLRGLRDSSWIHYGLAGLALGGMAMTRPLTAFAASIPWAVYTLGLLIRKRIGFANAAALACGIAVPTALLLAYNNATNGDPFTFGYTALYGEEFRLGFVQGPQELVFARFKHTPLRGIVNVNSGFHYLNRYLFGWPLPSLLFALLPFAVPSKNKWDYLMLAHLVSIPALYFFFLHQDFLMGPRYYFSLVPAAVILTARGLRETPRLWSRLAGSASESTAKVPVFLAVLITICCIFNFSFFFPSKLWFYRISSPALQGVPAPVWRHIDPEKMRNSVIFINDFPFSLAYGAGLWRNDPDLQGDIVYARDRGPDNAKLMEQYPDRKYYRYSFYTDTFMQIEPPGDSP